MEQKNTGISMEEAKRLASTPEAKQLYTMLQQQHSQQLNEAMANAAVGDFASVQKAMSALLSDPQTRQMIMRLKGNSDE